VSENVSQPHKTTSKIVVLSRHHKHIKILCFAYTHPASCKAKVGCIKFGPIGIALYELQVRQSVGMKIAVSFFKGTKTFSLEDEFRYLDDMVIYHLMS
jgi:hypothetical protein